MPRRVDRLIDAPLALRLRRRFSGLGHIGTWEPTPLDRVAARVRRPFDRAFFSQVGALDEQRRLGASVAAVAPRAEGPRVLVLSLRSWPHHNVVEAVIAHALRLRGAEVAIVTCGGGQPKCEVGWARQASPRPCDRCAWFTDRVADAARMKHYRVGDHLPWGRDAKAAPLSAGVSANGIDPHAVSHISLVWSLRTTKVERHPSGPRAERDYAVSADGVRAAAESIMDDFRPDVVFGLNGLFAADQVFHRVARERGVRAPTYEGGARAGHFVLGQESRAPLLDTRGLWERVRERPLSDVQNAKLDEVLFGRERGVGGHETYFDTVIDDSEALRDRLGIPSGARIASLFTNIAFDSAVVDRESAWPSMIDWVADAVGLAAEQQELHLVVRVHPGEVRWRSREPVLRALEERFGELPANVHTIGPDEELSSYALLRLSELVLVFATTVGLEAAVRGYPVAVAAQVHYRDKGFTHDLSGRDALRALFLDPPQRLDDREVEMARRYAYTYFFRAMVPFPAMERNANGTILRMPTDASEIGPGRDPYVDLVCDRILDGEPFEVPEDLLET